MTAQPGEYPSRLPSGGGRHSFSLFTPKSALADS